MMKGQKYFEMPTKSFSFLDTDFPPLQREKFENKSEKKDVTPGAKVPKNSKDKSVHHFDFGIPVMIIEQAVSNSSGHSDSTVSRPPAVMPKMKKESQKNNMTPGPKVPKKSKPVHHFNFGIFVMYIEQAVSDSNRPPVVMPKLKMQPKVNPLKAAAGPRPQPVSATTPQPSTGEVLGKLEGETAQLEAQKAAFLQEKQKLKAVLETVNGQVEMAKALFQKVVQEKEKLSTADSLKVEQLQAAVNSEQQQRIQAEKLLAELLAENKRLQDELSQAQKKLEEEKLQREEGLSRLLAEHITATPLMKAAAMKAQEDMEKERSQRLQERSSIQAAVKSLEESIDEEKEKFMVDKLSQVHHLEQTQEVALKKTKKRSLRMRFLQLFKRS